MNSAVQPIVQLDQVKFTWPGKSQPVLDIDEFAIAQGERVFLRGPSGSGKTTLLSLIAAVMSPQSGDITVDNVSLNTLKKGQRDQFRVDRMGLVFQQFNLLPFLSVRDNVQLPCHFSRLRRDRAMQNNQSLNSETDRLLNAMHLPPEDVINSPVTQLSVGQQQRVAVARALIGQPPLIIADEPTSALDKDTQLAFLELLFREVESAACTLLFVSHDTSLSDAFDRSIDLREINRASSQPSLKVTRA